MPYDPNEDPMVHLINDEHEKEVRSKPDFEDMREKSLDILAGFCKEDYINGNIKDAMKVLETLKPLEAASVALRVMIKLTLKSQRSHFTQVVNKFGIGA